MSCRIVRGGRYRADFSQRTNGWTARILRSMAEGTDDVGEGTPENVAEAAPVAAPAPVADTTPALYYYTPNGLRVHTTHTCRGLRNAKAIFVSPTCELRGKTRCNVCFLR